MSSLLNLRLLTEANITIPRIRLKSATFEPIKVPTPKLGIPFIAEIIPIVVSGNTVIKAIKKKLTMNSEICKTLDNFAEYLIANCELFANIPNEIKNNIKVVIILPLFSN